MTLEILLLLTLLAGAFVAFARELFPIEVTALALLGVLVAVGLVPTDLAFSGFSNKAVIAIGALFILAEALSRTGALERIADLLSRRFATRGALALALLLSLVAVMSGFLNNTAVVAMGIPMVMTLCGRFGVSPSKVLIPLSYASIFGGTLTLIGTSTNLLVSSIIEQEGVLALGVFEFTRLGIVFLVAGMAYVLLAAPRLLPDCGPGTSLTSKYGLGKYFSEVQVERGSKLIGKTLREARINERYAVLVLELLRQDQRSIEGIERMPLREGDHLLVEGTVEDLVRLRREQGLALLPDIKLSDRELQASGLMMVEGIVLPTGSMVGKTLKEIEFRRYFGGFVLAIRRPGETLRSKIGHVRLHAADSLVMLVPQDRLAELQGSSDLVIVSELGLPLRRQRAWWMALALLPVVVLLAALGWVEISIGAPLAVVVLLLLRVVTPQEAYRSVNWSVLFLIAAFIPVGHAVVATGTAELLVSGLIALASAVPGEATPWVAVCLLYLTTSLLTEVVSNNAAAIILVPIALRLGVALEVDPRAFVMAVCFAASAAFMTPTGYQTNLMVYGPGGYRFVDYFRVGVPLNTLFWLLGSLLIPWFWPFHP